MSLAKYSLNVYDPETLEILETLESHGLLWGDYVDIVDQSQQLKGKTDDETLMNNFEFVETTMFTVFPGLTKDNIRNCSADEMMSTLRGLLALGMKFKGSASGKAKN